MTMPGEDNIGSFAELGQGPIKMLIPLLYVDRR